MHRQALIRQLPSERFPASACDLFMNCLFNNLVRNSPVPTLKRGGSNGSSSEHDGTRSASSSASRCVACFCPPQHADYLDADTPLPQQFNALEVTAAMEVAASRMVQVA
jgi:hypothetical protein